MAKTMNKRDYFQEAVELYEGKTKKRIQPKKQHIAALMDRLMMLMIKTERLGRLIERLQMKEKLRANPKRLLDKAAKQMVEQASMGVQEGPSSGPKET